jgi:hypothetical protein
MWFRRKAKAAPLREHIDPYLGRMTFNSEYGCWEVPLQSMGRTVMLHVHGRDAPDPALLPRAREIAEAIDAFHSTLRDFIRDHITHFNGTPEQLRPYQSELETLELDFISLAWPRLRNDGMVYFRGGMADRGWRATFRGNRFEDLNFDD